MDVILFGGSFYPPHVGHRHVITILQKEFPKAKIYICPNSISPFKQNVKKFSTEEIWNLCKTEFESILSKDVILWDEEIRKAEISYTIDTLKALQRIEPNKRISLVVGEDNLPTFEKWKSYEEILNLTQFLIVVRRYTNPPLPIQMPKYLEISKLLVLDNPIHVMSSSELREKPPFEWGTDAVKPKTKVLYDSYLLQKNSKDSQG
ncbi:putative nicotinate-nucleotide adenylyltransferase [Leptospira yanagawae serovar Saopaulo str. Sao Paulo = ATCC 700523]|uniref:Probable nicotinate-nucleotide adenylyltransferase n=1 Tax=Leptospira yanagawae serovar Saopaulo str. Sao Paulo = ATCC 700523 TaxID=1249483 RepID=A0A5E8HAI0_9LEPT|nr:nicotinate-nicotinamide nucleotide adenylyltransferase [Leptospira yanagawae]EOQ88275.1 putative nicotinate-nucleotide adenylyltransferase [Leptospira yanagawae serovar Saopaulo str. Sao Paulo = ATCC 700523]